jgi:hypothetical protein
LPSVVVAISVACAADGSLTELSEPVSMRSSRSMATPLRGSIRALS